MGKYKNGNVSATQAAKELDMTVTHFKHCLINDGFPINIGVAVKMPDHKNFTYYVKREPLNQLKQLWGL